MTTNKQTKPPLTKIARAIVTWYIKNARTWPWRETSDPYAIWISEIMLQQTQSATVKPYFERFLKRFPTVDKLARAKQDTVLKAWEGLGYYSRARNLQAAAKVIVSDYNSKLPSTAQELLKLPGIGRYTAGAVASIAFGQDTPVVDGNVIRVLCRTLLVKDNPKSAATLEYIWDTAGKMIPSGQASQFNQGLMELGARICLPKNPDCPHCPVKTYCLAKKENCQEELPKKITKPKLPHYTIGVGIIWKDDKVLIDRRKSEGMLGGLWEFPGGKREKNESIKATIIREVREELGIETEITNSKPLAVVKHTYSHFRITLHAYEGHYLSGRCKAIGCDAYKWVTLKQLDKYAFPGANQTILKQLKERLQSE